MADYTTANLISAVSPSSFSTDSLTNQPIVVTFFRDMNAASFSDATVALQVVGTVLRVPITMSYAARLLTITPVSGLQAGTRYQLTLVGDMNPADAYSHNISGITDILGNGMIGLFTSEFTTGSIGVPGTPVLQLPVNQAAIVVQPVFSWQLIPADIFEIQVSTSNSFEVIYWPASQDNIAPITGSTVTPNRAFDVNIEYWWRVRAVQNGIPGAWSLPANFYYGNPALGVVTTPDVPLGYPAVPVPVTVYSAVPAPGAANLAIYPAAITITLAGSIDLSQIDNTTILLTSEAVDGEWDAQSAIPQFSPSLNGSMMGSGGSTYPAQVDSYQQIVVSGDLVGGVVSAAIVNGLVQLTLTISNNTPYFLPNNIYTVTLNLAELPAPLTWTFTSKYSPIFTSVRSVREWVDDLFLNAPVSDDDILYKIRHNSLYALFVQVYPPTQLDGESWIYDPPVSFDVNNPPYFCRKYVELKTARDFLQKKFWGLIGAGGRTTLGDYTVDKTSMALQGQVKYAYDTINSELIEWNDKLHGLTKRGYARGQWALRGAGQWGGNNTPGGHISNDNSYLWPRTSRPQF